MGVERERSIERERSRQGAVEKGIGSVMGRKGWIERKGWMRFINRGRLELFWIIAIVCAYIINH